MPLTFATPVTVKAIFNCASKVINSFFFSSLLCVCSENLRYLLNQSDAKLKPITTWSPAFSRALCSLVGFIWSSHWLIHVFSFLLIGRCDCFQGQHTPGKLGAVSSEDDEDDFSPYGETSRDEAKEGLVSHRILLSFIDIRHLKIRSVIVFQPSLSLSNLSSDSEAEGEELAQPEFRGLWEEGVHKVS